MSEKVTFQELIESIAEETKHSKQFTHDFLKDFVDVINDGLEQNGNVNIAGFGKFELRRVDEREGYNPQTEEKMIIPAHNKVIFKPYKGLRELVNAPYDHLEPELIEETDDSTSSEPTDDATTGKKDQQSAEESENTEDSAVEERDPFGFEAMDLDTSSSFSLEDEPEAVEDDSDEEDIVEFKQEAGQEPEEVDNELEDFIGSTESTEEDTQQQEFTSAESEEDKETEQQVEDFWDIEQPSEPGITPPEEEDAEAELEDTEAKENDASSEPTSPFAPPSDTQGDDSEEPEGVDETDTEEEKAGSPVLDKTLPHRTRKSSSSLPIVAAAVTILLLLAAGAWYLGTFSTGQSPTMTTKQTESSQISGTEKPSQQDKSQKTRTGNNNQQADPKTPKQPASKATPDQQTASQTPPKKEQYGIKKGQTLWSIAEDKYGNPRLWPWIYGNNGSLDDPDLIYAGSSLTVPLPSGPQNSLAASDSIDVAEGFLATYRWYKSQESPKARNHLWGAKLYHGNIQNLADRPLDKADLSYANSAR